MDASSVRGPGGKVAVGDDAIEGCQRGVSEKGVRGV